ncbi:hypothetical protein EDD28_0655 [Salana multivorans]|uniref:DUF2975 family protein n=1 Tax=Salana multivorans TaxID=120377 RepID=A0A3N2D8H1_9MICO|nr:hypothetical protein [Salana multivorans]ROR96081.1 hypothetical protein EDD28_0655 [Salana multivorans]
MDRAETVGWRLALGSLVVGALLVQVVLIPLVARSLASTYPDLADLFFAYTWWAIGAMCGVQAALLVLWRLVGLAAERTLTPSRLTRLTGIAAIFFSLAATAFACLFLHVGLVARLGSPSVLLGLLASLALALLSPVVIRTTGGLVARAGKGPAQVVRRAT